MFLLITSTFFFFNDTATTEIYTLSLHDALPISLVRAPPSEAGHPSRKCVARRGGERLAADEDIGGRHREDRGTGLVGHRGDFDRADASMFQGAALRGLGLDPEQVLRGYRREPAVGQGAHVVRPAVRLFQLVRREAYRQRAPVALLCERAVQRE